MDNLKDNRQSLKYLRASEIRYRRLFESARDGILIIDAISRKITDVNPFMIELLGYTKEEFLGKELWEIGLLKDENANIAAFKELQKNKYIRYDDLPLKTKNGEIRDVEVVSNVYMENDLPVIQCNIRDITQRKITEEALRKVEVNFRNLVESAPGIVYVNNPYPPYTTTYISPSIKEFGYSPEEWCAEPGIWMKAIHKEDRPRVLREFEFAVSQSLDTSIEYRIVARDGKIHWWQHKAHIVLDETGNKTGWLGMILDITETKSLEEQLRQSQKLESIGLLAGGIAHDFNNMLTAINGYSELTLRQLKDDDPVRHNIEEIRKAGLRSAELTYQLLAFSRRQLLLPVVIDLNEIIAETTKMLHRLISEDIEFSTKLNSSLGRVVVDPGQFSQILMNLVVNARDAMPQGGKLVIETTNVFLEPAYTRQHVNTLPGAYVLLTVSDTGTGMSDEIKQHIFEPFFTTKEKGRGTGLGLATVYGIIKQSNGNIEVYSEEGVGTTFKIYLPRVRDEIIEPEIKDSSILLRGTERILLVEDEEVVRNLSRSMLEICGYNITEARNGLEALKICDNESCEFDLLMTDVVMPQMGGRELADKLRVKLPHMRILFTSGYTDDVILHHSLIETNANFIQKPFTFDDLAIKIRELLDTKDENPRK